MMDEFEITFGLEKSLCNQHKMEKYAFGATQKHNNFSSTLKFPEVCIRNK